MMLSLMGMWRMGLLLRCKWKYIGIRKCTPKAHSLRTLRRKWIDKVKYILYNLQEKCIPYLVGFKNYILSYALAMSFILPFNTIMKKMQAAFHYFSFVHFLYALLALFGKFSFSESSQLFPLGRTKYRELSQ